MLAAGNDCRMPGALRRLYARLGPRYARRALLASLPAAYLFGLVATLVTSLYTDMTVGQFWRLLLASSVLIWTAEVALEVRLVHRRIVPVQAWASRARTPADAAAAWAAGAGLPLERLRHWPLYVAAVPGMALWALYAVSVLDLPAYSIAIFFVASVLVYLYWVALRFLAIELILRPVLEEVGRALPETDEFEPRRVPLRWRLLATLPGVNLVTGLAVGGFTTDRGEDLSGLGLALIGSAAAAIVVSSWLVLFLSTSITTPILELRDATRRIKRGDFTTRVAVASTDETGELARAFNEMAGGLEQRERLREAFGTFVDPDLTERVLREGTDLAGEEVELSLLFMDVRGFTAFSETAAARDVVARLNDLYGVVVPAIGRHGGHASKFIGDGLLAVFGAPNRLADHADCAVAAGIEIAQLVRLRYKGELRVGIGINTGRVVVGTIGGGGRLDFTVIGDAVNIAARVESANRQTDDDLLITDATCSALRGDHGGWIARGPLPLKGKTQQIALHAACSLAAPSAPTTAGPHGEGGS